MRFFFYGTLMDADLLQAVLARPVAPTALEPAVLPGFRRQRVRGRSYPMVRPDHGGAVPGILAMGLEEADALRLAWYEGDAYEIRECRLRDGGGGRLTAWVYVPRPGLMTAGGDWRFEAWRRQHKAAALSRLGVPQAVLTAAQLARARAAWRRRKPL